MSRRKFIAGLGAAALTGFRARAQTNAVLRKKEESNQLAHRTPKIDFFYCAHEMKHFDFPNYAQTFANAKKEGHPYNTVFLEFAELTHQEKARLEQIIDRNAEALIAISKKTVANQRGANDPVLNQKYFQEFLRLCPLQNNFVLHSLLVAFANDVRRVRFIESYSQREIEQHFKSRAGEEMGVEDYVKTFARFVKFRNQRMGETIFELRKKADTDPYYANNPLRAMTILGAGHGGFNLEHGTHNEVVKRIRANGGKTSIGVISTFNQALKPTNFREILEAEAVRLAQKSSVEIESYKIPKKLYDLGEQLLKMQKKNAGK